MGRFFDALGTLASSFGIGPKGTRATLDASALSSSRTLVVPDLSGTLALLGVIFASGAGTTIASSTALSPAASFTLPANSLGDGTKRAVRVRITGRYRNNSGSTSTLRLQFTYGGQTLWDDTSTGQTSATGIHAYDLDVVLQGAGATNAQNFGGKAVMSVAAAPTTGSGTIAAVPAAANGLNAALSNGNTPTSVDSTANQTFALNAQHSVNNAATIFTVDSIVASLIS